MSSTLTTPRPMTESIRDYVNAAFTGLYVHSDEPDEAEREIVQLAKSMQWTVTVWDCAQGSRFPLTPEKPADKTTAGDPLTVLARLPGMATERGTAVLLLHNFQSFLKSAEISQTVFNALLAGKHQRTFIIILSATLEIPKELSKLFVVVEHPLPDRQAIRRIGRELCTDGGWPEDEAAEQHVLSAASGLTRYEAEGAFALSIARHGAVRPDEVWELKSGALKKSGLLKIHRGGERFDSLGGMNRLKSFSLRALAPRVDQTVQPRGVLLLGVPGSGKTQWAKCLGNETGRPMLHLDVGALYGSLVGQTEANVRQALAIADAMAPCILFVDEIEKALAGVGGQGDSGVATRLFGTILTWLNDHTTDVFFVGTCNDISRIPPEFTRAERFDGVFFIDLPGDEEKQSIWTIYRKQYGIQDGVKQPDDTQWTGSEIKSCCRLSALLGVPLTEAALNIVPVARLAGGKVESLRNWASGLCLDANRDGVYQYQPGQHVEEKTVRRSIHRN